MATVNYSIPRWHDPKYNRRHNANQIQLKYHQKLRLKSFVSQKNRSYFQDEQIKGFHTEFQCSKKGMTLVEQFNIKQEFK